MPAENTDAPRDCFFPSLPSRCCFAHGRCRYKSGSGFNIAAAASSSIIGNGSSGK
ncbi:hypothetical protein KCP75_01690 [Salmonella enterica subsp. enterica]|nr:hypothetical protein KCP75_01690 [Salmonella enterica subsp. enterica]